MDAAESWPYWTEADAEPSGVINNYRIGKRIYNGPFSFVFHGTAVRGPHLGKQLAFKFLKHRKNVAEAPRIDHELQLLRNLRHHSIVPMLSDFRHNTYHCIVFPYAEHGTLEDFIFRQKSRTRLSLEQAHAVLFQLLEALEHVHAMGFVHSDVKPANVLIHSIDDKGRPRVWLCDFGLTKSHEEAEKFAGRLGTDFYEAPELFARRGFSEKVDLWAVGVILYRLVTGLIPFTSRVDINPRRLPVIFQGPAWCVKSEKVKVFVGRMLEIDPKKRLSAKDAMKDAWVSSLIETVEKCSDDLEKEVLVEPKVIRGVTARAN
jgi:serine/threonine protein kinase